MGWASDLRLTGKTHLVCWVFTVGLTCTLASSTLEAGPSPLNPSGKALGNSQNDYQQVTRGDDSNTPAGRSTSPAAAPDNSKTSTTNSVTNSAKTAAPAPRASQAMQVNCHRFEAPLFSERLPVTCRKNQPCAKRLETFLCQAPSRRQCHQQKLWRPLSQWLVQPEGSEMVKITQQQQIEKPPYTVLICAHFK